MAKKITKLDIEQIKFLYFEKKKSAGEIARELGTYSKAIERALRKAGCELRTRSEAQKERISKDNSLHPTLGKKHSDETKKKIAKSVHKSWDSISEKEKKRRSKISKENYKKREDTDALVAKGRAASKQTSQTGSKLEHAIADTLRQNGYHVLIHQKHVISNKNMHIDLLLPAARIAIEVDGPAHYEEIWGPEVLEKNQKKDKKKNDFLIGEKYHVIRVYSPSNLSLYKQTDLEEKTLECVKKIIPFKDLQVFYIGKEYTNA